MHQRVRVCEDLVAVAEHQQAFLREAANGIEHREHVLVVGVGLASCNRREPHLEAADIDAPGMEP